MRPPLVAGHRSTPWDDTEDNLCPFPKHFVTLVSLFSSFSFPYLLGEIIKKKKFVGKGTLIDSSSNEESW